MMLSQTPPTTAPCRASPTNGVGKPIKAAVHITSSLFHHQHLLPSIPNALCTTTLRYIIQNLPRQVGLMRSFLHQAATGLCIAQCLRIRIPLR